MSTPAIYSPSTSRSGGWWRQPENIFLVLGLLIGALFCIAIPFNAGFDEEIHLMRIFEISGLHLRPNSSSPQGGAEFPIQFLDLSYQRRYYANPAFDLFAPEKFQETFGGDDLVRANTRAIYPPVGYLPQAFLAGVSWRLLSLPVIPVAIAMRLVGLWIYVFGIYLAIRWLPFGKWVMLVLGLGPSALYQASTLNLDGYSTVVSFLWISCVLKLYVDRAFPSGFWPKAGLLGLALAVALAKPGLFVLLFLLVILPPRWYPSRRWFWALWGSIVLGVVLALAWNLLAVPPDQITGEDQISLSQQLQTILASPLAFLQFYVGGIFRNVGRYWTEWVGIYGHWVGVVPSAVYGIYAGALGAALVAEKRLREITFKTRLLIFAFFLLNCGVTTVLLYVKYYQGNASDNILGVQGRYFLPLAPLFYLTFAGWIHLPESLARLARPAAIGLALVAIGAYSFGMAAVYYTYCGQSGYTQAACVLPVYKNLDKAGAAQVEINTSTSLTQTFIDDCGSMNSVSVYIKGVSAAPQGDLRFSLLDPEGNLAASSEFSTAEIADGKYLEMSVAPPAGTFSRLYTLKLDSRNISVGHGPLIATTPERNYSEGNLAQNGVQKNADLIFHYTCNQPDFR